VFRRSLTPAKVATTMEVLFIKDDKNFKWKYGSSFTTSKKAWSKKKIAG
jgi:hypothetical protein